MTFNNGVPVSEHLDTTSLLSSKIHIVLALVFIIPVFLAYNSRTSYRGLHILNPKKPFEFTVSKAKARFAFGARVLLRDWFESHPNEPVYVNADVGPVVVLPPRLANEVRNDSRLSFKKFTVKSFHGTLPGFEGFSEKATGKTLVPEVITKDLTKHLTKVTEDLVDETTFALEALVTENKEWHEIPLKETILRLIARISSRVFLGQELCRNEDWLRVTREYTVVAFGAAEELRLWPRFTRPVVHWFLPACQRSRALVAEARRVIQPVLDRRRKLKSEAKANGEETPVFNDAIEWFERTSKGGSYDPAITQLVMSLAAIHTTTDLVCQTLKDIAQHPDILAPLRSEISSVLAEDGWKKTSLYKMKLLDSVIKESQRLKPIGITAMRRIALDRMVLSDGTVIDKNMGIAVSSHNMWDSDIHETPKEWNGYRFFQMREAPEKQNLAQLVTTSPDHLAWGHGKHACPGRFFAANEVKIALINIIMKYDFELADGAQPTVREFGFSLGADPFLTMKIRRNGKNIVV